MGPAPCPDGRVGIDLHWLPLGAGGNFVRLNGRIYEAIKARLERRPVFDLYHSALEVFVPEGRYVIENTPVIDGRGQERGVVAEGLAGGRAPGWIAGVVAARKFAVGAHPDARLGLGADLHSS